MSLIDSIQSKLNGFGAVVLIEFKNNDALCTKGKTPSSSLNDVKIILAEFQVRRAVIKKTAQSKWSFSKSIPEAAHQRLRNVLTRI